MKAIEQYFHVVLIFSLWLKPQCVASPMKATEECQLHYRRVAVFLLYVKGVPRSMEVERTAYYFLSKMLYKRVRDWSLAIVENFRSFKNA